MEGETRADARRSFASSRLRNRFTDVKDNGKWRGVLPRGGGRMSVWEGKEGGIDAMRGPVSENNTVARGSCLASGVGI